MDYDHPAPKTPSKKDLSKTPSWIMLGFIAGGLAVLGIQREFNLNEPPPAAPVAQVESPPAEPARSIAALENRPSLSVLEATFVEWTQFVVWENDLTEVAFWNGAAGDFTDFFEVRREGETYFFRSIPGLTRLVYTEGVPTASPFRFTETEEYRRQRLKRGRN